MTNRHPDRSVPGRHGSPGRGRRAGWPGPATVGLAALVAGFVVAPHAHGQGGFIMQELDRRQDQLMQELRERQRRSDDRDTDRRVLDRREADRADDRRRDEMREIERREQIEEDLRRERQRRP